VRFAGEYRLPRFNCAGFIRKPATSGITWLVGIPVRCANYFVLFSCNSGGKRDGVMGVLKRSKRRYSVLCTTVR
jgi:hypothetical protein